MYKLIDRESIKVGKRFRQSYPNLPSLAESIEKFGILQPLIIDKDLNLVAGGRRLQASGLIQPPLKKIPVIIREKAEPLELKEIELEENIEREDLEWPEEIEAQRQIDLLKKERFGDQEKDRSKDGWSIRKTAEMLGKSVGSVAQDINLAEAIQVFPTLGKAKNKAEAHRLLKKLVEGVAIEELAKRDEVQENPHFKYASDHYKIGDVVKGLKSLKKQTNVSFIEVDPPYGIDLQGQKKNQNEEQMEEYQEMSPKEYIKLITQVSKELFRISADHCWMLWWFGQEHYQTTFDILSKVGWNVDMIPNIWYKEGSPMQANQPEYYLARGYETFFLCRKGNPVMVQRGKANVFPFPSVPSKKKIHPTEKPIELMNALLDIFTLPGTISCVPFLGSGITLRALYHRGLGGFGWDLSEKYKQSFINQITLDISEGLL